MINKSAVVGKKGNIKDEARQRILLSSDRKAITPILGGVELMTIVKG